MTQDPSGCCAMDVLLRRNWLPDSAWRERCCLLDLGCAYLPTIQPMKILPASILFLALATHLGFAVNACAEDSVIAHFESTNYGDWKLTGTAFQKRRLTFKIRGSPLILTFQNHRVAHSSCSLVTLSIWPLQPTISRSGIVCPMPVLWTKYRQRLFATTGPGEGDGASITGSSSL